MNNLNLNQEQKIAQLVQALLAPTEKGECRCHWIDPTKTPILVWKSAKDPDTLVLKIAQQKFIGLVRSDKNNELYWKFRSFYEAEETGTETPVPKPTPTPPPKPPTVNLPVPPAPNLAVAEQVSNQAAEDCEQVKKFREKFGEFSASKAK